MDRYHAPLLPGNFYHILNRGNNQENIFLTEANYRFFLKKWMKYILPYTETIAYCLMPNHLHFLIKVKPEKEILISALEEFELPKLRNFLKSEPSPRSGRKTVETLKTGDTNNLPALLNTNRFLEERFQRCFGSYAQAFNKQWNRTGSLFQKRFKRILVDSNAYLSWIIHYIHRNPIHHHFTDKYETWKFSSYNAIIRRHKTSVSRDFVINRFGSISQFVEFHNKNLDYSEIENYLFEGE